MRKRFKQMLYIGLGLLAILVAAAALAILGFDMSQRYTFFTVGAIMLLYVLVQWMRYAQQPKREVHIATKVELSSPPRLLKSVQNYKLKVSTSKHIEEKGQERTLLMDEIQMSFNSKDHPDAYAYCLEVIGQHMEASLQAARRAHPDALVVASPLRLPPSIKALEQ